MTKELTAPQQRFIDELQKGLLYEDEDADKEFRPSFRSIRERAVRELDRLLRRARTLHSTLMTLEHVVHAGTRT
jgi:hypothetical protein